MFKKSSNFYILLFAAVFIMVSDVVVMKNKVLFGGDEIISYLCATGNSVAYESVLNQQYPYGELVDASEYKNFLTIHQPYCFKKIASDLCANDMHPPLYYWMLHLFVLQFGVNIYTGILLNLLLQLFTLFFVFKLALHFLIDEHKAVIASFIWAISPACFGVSMNARPYELLALVTVIYLFLFFRWINKQSKFNILMLVFIGVAGMLTHYSFMYVLAACVAFAIFKIKEIAFRNVAVITVAAVVSFELMTIIHPCYFDSFLIQQQRKQEFLFNEIPFRVLKIMLSLIQFVIPVFSAKSLLMKINSQLINLLLALFMGVSGMLIILFRKQLFRKMTYPKLVPVTWQMLSILAAMIFLPYLLFITPVHAIGEQYLVYLYPLMAIVLVQVNLSFSKQIKIAILLVMFLGSCSSLFLTVSANNYQYAAMIEKVETHNVIETNMLDRRAFPRFIPYLKSGQKILIDENFANRNDSLSINIFKQNKVLMIYGKEDKIYEDKFGVKEQFRYDTGDGIIFFVKQGKRLLY
ncbi:MAG: glycosyltransferase family 39 protein [Bacteroidota bacterium]